MASRQRIGPAEYHVVEAGSGEPLLLLHGFPETHACWERVAPDMARSRRVVMPDLRGYGASEAPPGGPRGEGYSKRDMANELVQLMATLGHDNFAVVGHDRGARVAFRLALDHPDRVTHVALLNIVPTLEQFERMGAGPSLGYWPWFLLAQPTPFPERMLAADPVAVLQHVFDNWASTPDAIGPESREAYLRALTRSTIAAMCADYRASFYLDRDHDAEDRAADRRITVPLLVVIGEDEEQLAGAAEIWQAWATNLTLTRVPGGHFIPEEAPAELARALAAFLAPRGEDGTSGSA